MSIKLHHHFIDKLAVINGVFSGFALFPQVFVAISQGSSDGISIVTYGIILVNSIVWLAYSVHRGLFSLAIPSILNILASAVVIIWILFLK